MDSLLFLGAASGFVAMFGEPNIYQIASGAIGGVIVATGISALISAMSDRMSGPRVVAPSGPETLDTNRWESLPALIGKLTEVNDPNQVFKVILESTMEHLECEYCALLILRDNQYQYEAGIGLCEESRQAFKLNASDGLVDFMRTKGQSVVLKRGDRQLNNFKFLREPISEIIISPMRTGDNIFALLFVANKSNMGKFSRTDFDMLSMISMPFALALYQAITFKRAQSSVVSSIVEIITHNENVTPYIEGHSERVAEMSVAIGRELRMSATELTDLRNAALLHDLGKFTLPLGLRLQEVLPDGGPERELLVLQDKTAVSWLKPLGFVEKSLPLILNHHERYDGSGYPNGVRGPAIPIGAMVIAVAETFDILTHDRPDHPARPAKDVKSLILSLSGSKFDPQVIRAFKAVMEDA